jgi:hypothetical protein
MEPTATTDPLQLDEHPIPNGWVLIEGQRLQNTARSCGIPYRLACQNDYNERGVKTYSKTLGIIIPEEHQKQMAAGLARRAATKIRQSKAKISL